MKDVGYNMGPINYNEMPFEELFHLVFADSGRVNACGRDACSAMIKRLEDVYEQPGEFGDVEHGRLKIPEAFNAAKGLFWLKP